MLQYRAETRKEREEESRLAKAIASIEVIAEWSTCKVASTSDPDAFYFVDYNKNFYAVSCECEGHAHGCDCIHKLAVDRYFDAIRPSFHEMAGTVELVKGMAYFAKECEKAREVEEQEVISPVSIPAQELVEHVDSGLDAAIHEYLNPCEALAPTKARRSEVCGHLVKSDVNRHCGCMA